MQPPRPKSSRTKTSSSDGGAAAQTPPPVEPGVDPTDPPVAERRRELDRRRPVRIRSPHDETPLEAMGDFARRVYKKADQDGIFFMAGAIAFNVLVAIVPLLLATLGIAGQILQKRAADPETVLLDLILNSIPPVSVEFAVRGRELLQRLLDQSSGFTIVGLLLLMWFSTRMVGTLRFTLREVFDVGMDRNILKGKLFDLKMVLFAGTLLAINVSLTFFGQILNNVIERYGGQWLGRQPLSFIEAFYLNSLAILSAWVMFLLIYRYLPFRRIHWNTAIVAATFTTIFFELLKRAFGWYVANIADYGSTYGNVANLIILFLWVYYSAIVFILGGEVGQVAALRRIRRRQKERLG